MPIAIYARLFRDFVEIFLYFRCFNSIYSKIQKIKRENRKEWLSSGTEIMANGKRKRGKKILARVIRERMGTTLFES